MERLHGVDGACLSGPPLPGLGRGVSGWRGGGGRPRLVKACGRHADALAGALARVLAELTVNLQGGG